MYLMIQQVKPKCCPVLGPYQLKFSVRFVPLLQPSLYKMKLILSSGLVSGTHGIHANTSPFTCCEFNCFIRQQYVAYFVCTPFDDCFTVAIKEFLCMKNAGAQLQWISAKMKVWHLWQLKNSKSWGPISSYQLISTANSAHLPQVVAKWAELAVLFSWQLQNGPQDFDFFNYHRCRLLI